MPQLENLRKQAKQIHRWHREGHYPVAAMIRQFLPAFCQFTDSEIIGGTFRLADAHKLVARREGYESWSSLVRDLRASSTEARTHARPRLTGVEPQLFTTNLAEALAYYKRLGFDLEFAYGEPPFYAQVRRDAVCLNFRLTPAPHIDPAKRSREELLSASILVEEVKILFLEFQANGAEFHRRLRKEPWGARTFIVRDPDGNLVLFAGS